MKRLLTLLLILDLGRADKMDRIIFCSFMEKDERAYQDFIPQSFPPSTEEAESKGKGEPPVNDDGKVEEDEGVVPDLPDVPTTEPTEEGEPEPKKAKLDEHTEQKS